ncbi:IS66 family insertion sequence element accessory protein TnpA [Luteolibacter soli]|uniref:Transposase n=1 Tax=Luteolibacter soli TaxID=3135280 RepID=A0ABU9B3R3_9BACT
MRSDRRGRLRYAPGQREAILDAFASSGLSGPKFAALHGVKYQTFAAWIQKRKHAGTPAALPAPAGLALVEVEAPAGPCRDPGLSVILPGGGEIHVASMAAVPLAAALIRELSRSC